MSSINPNSPWPCFFFLATHPRKAKKRFAGHETINPTRHQNTPRILPTGGFHGGAKYIANYSWEVPPRAGAGPIAPTRSLICNASRPKGLTISACRSPGMRYHEGRGPELKLSDRICCPKWDSW